MKKHLSLALGFLCLLCACSVKKEMSVTQIRIGGTENVRHEIENAQTVFAPGDHTVYVHVFTADVAKETELEGIWWYKPRNARIFGANVKVTPEAPVAKFFLSTRTDWPLGEYRFQVLAGGKQIGEITYTVEKKL